MIQISQELLKPQSTSGGKHRKILEQRPFIAKTPQLSVVSHLFCGCAARCVP